MTTDVITATEDTPYETLVALLAEHDSTVLPVIKQDGGEGCWLRVGAPG